MKFSLSYLLAVLALDGYHVSAAPATTVKTEKILEGWLPLTSPKDSASFDLHRWTGNHNSNIERKRWMSLLDDSAPLSAISIPGTHCSTCTRTDLQPSEQHQNIDFGFQLWMGVRYLDVTLCEVNGELYTPDGKLFSVRGSEVDWPEWKRETTFVGELQRFLTHARSEVITVRLRRDPREKHNSKTSVKKFLSAYAKHVSLIARDTYWGNNNRHRANNLVYTAWYQYHNIATDYTGKAAVLPKLGDVRGKIFFLIDFPGAEDAFKDLPLFERSWIQQKSGGLFWPPSNPNNDQTASLIDVLEDTPGPVDNYAGVAKIWNKVSKHIDDAVFGARGKKDRLYITYATGGSASGNFPYPKPPQKGLLKSITSLVSSAFGSMFKPSPLADQEIPKDENFVAGATPIEIAAGTGGKKSNLAVGINRRIVEKLAPLKGKTRGGRPRSVGIIAMDFPGEVVVDSIISLNFPLPKDSGNGGAKDTAFIVN